MMFDMDDVEDLFHVFVNELIRHVPGLIWTSGLCRTVSKRSISSDIVQQHEDMKRALQLLQYTQYAMACCDKDQLIQSQGT